MSTNKDRPQEWAQKDGCRKAGVTKEGARVLRALLEISEAQRTGSVWFDFGKVRAGIPTVAQWRTIQALCERGLVNRHGGNQRGTLLSLTPAGREILKPVGAETVLKELTEARHKVSALEIELAEIQEKLQGATAADSPVAGKKPVKLPPTQEYLLQVVVGKPGIPFVKGIALQTGFNELGEYVVKAARLSMRLLETAGLIRTQIDGHCLRLFPTPEGIAAANAFTSES